jgi:hypothetical protein
VKLHLKIELLLAFYTMESYDGYDAFACGLPQSLRIAVENGNANVVNTVIDILLDIDAI